MSVFLADTSQADNEAHVSNRTQRSIQTYQESQIKPVNTSDHPPLILPDAVSDLTKHLMR